MVPIPIIASGGAGKLEHFADAVDHADVDAVLAASVFHFGDLRIVDVKRDMAARGIAVRLPSTGQGPDGRSEDAT